MIQKLYQTQITKQENSKNLIISILISTTELQTVQLIILSNFNLIDQENNHLKMVMAISSCSNSDIHQSKDLNGTSNYHSGARMFSVLTMHFQLHSPHDSHQYLACFKIFTFSTSHEFNNVMQETDSKLKVSPRCVK